MAINRDHLSLLLSLQVATACLNEAAARMTQLVRERPTTSDLLWERQYAAARQYFVHAHERYQASLYLLASHTSETLHVPMEDRHTEAKAHTSPFSQRFSEATERQVRGSTRQSAVDPGVNSLELAR